MLRHFTALLLNGLRDYGTPQWEGGDPSCEHKSALGKSQNMDKLGEKFRGGGKKHSAVVFQPKSANCKKCGAKRTDTQIGLESSPDCLGWATKNPCGECYVCHLVAVFREVRRVLRDDGTLVLNLGDSYVSVGGTGQGRHWDGREKNLETQSHRVRPSQSLREKNLIGIPWRVALALQADGWVLRSDIIWAKPNPMPESVADRPTKSHEYLFLFAKQAKYYYDAGTIREGTDKPLRPQPGYRRPLKEKVKTGHLAQGHDWQFRDPERVWNVAPGRNKTTVWRVVTECFPGAHFAVFPAKLIKPCVLACCPTGGTILDPFCGAGTTGLVSLLNNRKFIGIELYEEYRSMAAQRLRSRGRSHGDSSPANKRKGFGF